MPCPSPGSSDGGGAVRVSLRIRPFTMREYDERAEACAPEAGVFSFPDPKNRSGEVVARAPAAEGKKAREKT